MELSYWKIIILCSIHNVALLYFTPASNFSMGEMLEEEGEYKFIHFWQLFRNFFFHSIFDASFVRDAEVECALIIHFPPLEAFGCSGI